MKVEIFLDEDRGLYVRTPFALKDVCKSVLGARWDPEVKAWKYPPTTGAAVALADAFRPYALTWSDSAQGLLDRAAQQAEAQAHKTAETLANIPLENQPAWHHQKQCYWFSVQLLAVMIAADMGTGKSRMCIDLLVNRGHRLVLVCCPKSVIKVWPGEFAKHAARPYTVITLDEGSVADRMRKAEKEIRLAQARKERAAVVMNYESIWREPMAEFALKTRWDCVVLDESHRIKSPGGQASKFLGRLADNVLSRICLTGTPMPHSPLDIYAQYRFLDKGVFGTSFTAFRNRYAEMGGYGNYQVLGYQNQQELHAKMYSIAFRVLAEDVQDLPETMDLIRPVTISAAARKVYEQIDEDFVASVDAGQVTVTNALTRLLRLQQVTSGFITLDRDVEHPTEKAEIRELDTAKADVLADILEDLQPTEPVAIFCRFQRDLDTIKLVAKSLNRGCAELSGRMNELEAWQQDRDGKLPLIAVQIQAGGVGVNLVRAHYCVYFSLGYSLGDYLQSRKRTHRPGQNERVTYFHLIAEKTVDETVYQALEKRQNVVEMILSTVRGRHLTQEGASCK